MKLLISIKHKFPFLKITTIKKQDLLKELKSYIKIIIIANIILLTTIILTFLSYYLYYYHFLLSTPNEVIKKAYDVEKINIWVDHTRGKFSITPLSNFNHNTINLWNWMNDISKKINMWRVFSVNNSVTTVCVYFSKNFILDHKLSHKGWRFVSKQLRFSEFVNKFTKDNYAYIQWLAIPTAAIKRYNNINSKECNYAIVLMKWFDKDVFYHEMWHIVNYYMYQNNEKFREEFNNKFQQYFDKSKKDDFITKYGSTDFYESFAVIFDKIISWNIRYSMNKTYLLNKKIDFIKKWTWEK